MALRIALDTNRYTDLCRGDPDVTETLALAEVIYLPFVVIAELRAGFSMGRYGMDNKRIPQGFSANPEWTRSMRVMPLRSSMPTSTTSCVF